MKTIIASGPVIIEKNKVLLNKHGDDKFWKFPGGRIDDVDFGKNQDVLEKTCKREVKEEMGIEIEIIRPLKPILIKKDESTLVILIHYLADRVGEIKPGNDILESEWFDIDNLPNDCAPNIQPVIDSI